MQHSRLTPFLTLLVFPPLSLLQIHDHPVPILQCRLSEHPPIIDGMLDDPCWNEAEVATGFLLLNQKGLAREQTEGMVSYDSRNLYVGIICMESEKPTIRRQEVRKDGPVWTDDCIEVFLDPRHDHVGYFHLITNLNSTRYDESGRIGVSVPNPTSWDAAWVVRTALIEDGWTVEISIPFEAFGISTPRAGSIWSFNLNRQEHRLREQSSWSETSLWFHEPRNFGHLLFTPPL